MRPFQSSPALGFVLLALCPLVAGCTTRRAPSYRGITHFTLAPLPKTASAHPRHVLGEAERLLQEEGIQSLVLWRRLSWLHFSQGNRAKALELLDRAVALMDQNPQGGGQESAERSTLADQYLAMRAPEGARNALGAYRYQGSSPQAQKLLRRSELTPLELQRLETPEAFLVPHLVIRTGQQGAQEALLKQLRPRIQFILRRGPEGREEIFHGAMVLQFYLDTPAAALQATERQSPSDSVRTLGCLYWGGTSFPSRILFSSEFLLKSGQVPERPQIRRRLLEALSRLTPSSAQDLELLAIAFMAQQEHDQELQRAAIGPLSEPSHRKKLLEATAQNQWLSLPAYAPEQSSLLRLSFLSRHLGQLIGMQPGPLQNHLLLEFLSQMRGDPKERLFFNPLARLFRQRGQRDLLQRLSRLQPDEAFQSHELLMDAEEALTRRDKQAARLSLEAALLRIERIPKPSHKAQSTLLAQEIARRLGDRELLMRLERQLTSQLPQVSIRLLQNDLNIRLAGLRALCGDLSGYQDLVSKLQQSKSTDTSELILSGDLMERLAAEQVRIGRVEDAWVSIQQVPIDIIQASALLKTAEQLLEPPPLPSSPPLLSLQSSTGRGLSLVGPR